MTARIPAILLAIALGLFLVVVYQTLAPVPQIAEPAAHTAAYRPQPVPPAYVPPPESAFAVINARPLFDPARQPAPEPEQTGPRSVAPPDLSLVGVAIASRVSVALLKRPGARPAISVSLGQSIDGWKLTGIGPDFVVLHSGATDFTIRLRAAAGLPQPRLNGVSPPVVTGQPGP